MLLKNTQMNKNVKDFHLLVWSNQITKVVFCKNANKFKLKIIVH